MLAVAGRRPAVAAQASGKAPAAITEHIDAFIHAYIIQSRALRLDQEKKSINVGSTAPAVAQVMAGFRRAGHGGAHGCGVPRGAGAFLRPSRQPPDPIVLRECLE
jgi:hypothetical protein